MNLMLSLKLHNAVIISMLLLPVLNNQLIIRNCILFGNPMNSLEITTGKIKKNKKTNF